MQATVRGGPLAPGPSGSPSARPGFPSWLAATAALVGAGARGFVLGALAVTLICAGYASQSIHTGVRAADVLIGVALVGVALLAVFLAVAVPAACLGLLLGFAARRAPGGVARVLRAPLPILRFLRRPLVTSALAVVLMVWGSSEDGPLSLYHSLWFFEIPLAGGAVVGLLLGMAWYWLGTTDRVSVRIAGTVTALAATTLAIGGAAWCVLPGAGDTLAHEDPSALARVAQLSLPDPSAPGPYRVVAASYGSGTDAHRAEYGAHVTWRTPTVDVAAALPDRGGIADAYSDWYWGFDESRLPLNGLVWYPPEAPGRLPIVLIVHGNHDAEEYSDPGYAYLAENLASHGMLAVSIDENYLNGDAFYDYAGEEMGVRAWLLLRHLDQLRTWDADSGHPFGGRLDLQRVALIGHSRGGEAAAVAAMLEQDGLTPPGLPKTPTGLGIRTVVAIAPSDTMYMGLGTPVTLRDIDYLVLQGAHDGDLPGVDGLRMYHRLEFSGSGNHLKVALYSQGSNHGRFNSVWDVGDAGLLQSWMLDRGSMLTMAAQQRLAKTAIGAFLARSLQGQTGYDAFFRDPRAGRAWLPEDVVETHWQSSGRVVVNDFLVTGLADSNVETSGIESAAWIDPGLRDGLDQADRAARLISKGPAALTFPVQPGMSARLGPGASVVFAMAPVNGGAVPDPTVELGFAGGRTASVRLSAVAPPRPALATYLWKLPVLGDRYLPTERHAFSSERFLQTYAVPVERIVAGAGLDASKIRSVGFRFDRPASIYLDDVAFEPPPIR